MYRLMLVLLAASTLPAQRHRVNINTETPEGQLLQMIGQEASNADRKMAMMEEFVNKYARHESVGWVLEQVIAAQLKSNNFDKALASCQQLLAVDPDDPSAAHSCLKAAEGKKDLAGILKWAPATSALARKLVASPAPKDEEAAESWKNQVDYAKQLDTYTEYALYANGLATTDPNQKIAFRDALEKQSPNSQYLPQLNGQYFLALRQTNQTDKAIAFAEKILEKDQTNEDMLVAVADNYINRKINPEKVIEYGTKLGQLMESKPKPEGVSDDDWNKRKTLMAGIGYWMAGVTYFNQNKLAETDANLRKALPYIVGNDALNSQALFFLGLSNYKMGEPKKDKKLMAEALKFNAQCATIKGPFQGQAQKNAQVIRQQYGLK
ncbi:MAG: hypothetical protein HY820_44885 [Acidobacteria bacterium]|nr:hypothetical protein [Acidobacteriota bacterium]